ncbi:MAG: hypothetical protein Q4P15_00695 [Propionibacteriaceae bacterium]|nr:hypothetical protein [Propionibacteriaceae bacterium]
MESTPDEESACATATPETNATITAANIARNLRKILTITPQAGFNQLLQALKTYRMLAHAPPHPSES